MRCQLHILVSGFDSRIYVYDEYEIRRRGATRAFRRQPSYAVDPVGVAAEACHYSSILRKTIFQVSTWMRC